MTLSRFSLVLLGTLGLCSLGCGDGDDTADDTGNETDTDADADADTDTDGDSDPDYFEPYWFSWEAHVGVKDGQFATAYYDGNEIPSYLQVMLAEEEYPEEDYDPRYACYLYYAVTSMDGTSDPKAWFDWALDLSVPLEGLEIQDQEECDNLDPAMFGDDPWDAIASMAAWEMTVFAIEDEMAEDMEDAFGDDWDMIADAVYSTDTYWDGGSFAEQAEMPIGYGWATAVDADMNILDEEFVPAVDVATGANGYYLLGNWYMWSGIF